MQEILGLLAGDSEVQAAAGPYQARELIGRGGMGAVYLATREDGEVRMKVAIKVIASQFWSSMLEDRFRRERQIIAQLRHPNIASFLDGGVSAEGLPFLAMEYVEGKPFDRLLRLPAPLPPPASGTVPSGTAASGRMKLR